jgi:hypothetical protein
MGCGGSKTTANTLVVGNDDIPTVDISGMDRYTRFEHSFPFYRTRVETFEGRVKRFVY